MSLKMKISFLFLTQLVLNEIYDIWVNRNQIKEVITYQFFYKWSVKLFSTEKPFVHDDEDQFTDSLDDIWGLLENYVRLGKTSLIIAWMVEMFENHSPVP